jgi:hypothetical protein
MGSTPMPVPANALTSSSVCVSGEPTKLIRPAISASYGSQLLLGVEKELDTYA